MTNALIARPAGNPAAPAKPKQADAADNRGKLCDINIRCTKNGFVVTASYEPKSIDPKVDRFNQMPDDEHMVFENAQAMVAYITKLTGEPELEEAPAPKPAAPAPAPYTAA